MKKIALMIAFLGATFTIVNSQTIPGSIVSFGQEYEKAYAELVDKLSIIEQGLADKKGSFNSYDELISYSSNEWNRLSGSNQLPIVDFESISATFEKIGKGGVNYSSVIAGLSCSERLKSILNSINSSIHTAEDEDEFMNILDNHSMQINSYILSAAELNNLKMYLMAIYANYSVVKAGKMVSESVVEGRRSFWRWLGQCLAGTVGGAGLGFLQGAGTGTVVLPVVGTVSGATVGTVSGALVGAAAACF